MRLLVLGQSARQGRSYLLSSEKLKSEFNWQAQVSLDEGIDQVFSWVKANIESLENWRLVMLTKSEETVGNELDLLANYPRTDRNLKERLENKTEKDREIARRFGRQFFDGDRRHGYGGFHYSPKFWQPVVPTFVDYWKIETGLSC